MKTTLDTMDIGAEPAAVYRALPTAEGLRGWWSTRVFAEMELGGRIHFTFIESFNPVMEIVTLEPGRRVEWRCVDGQEPWPDNTFHFDVHARDERCVVSFNQEYAQELDDEEYGRYNFNWGYYLHSLKKLCETGADTPYRPG